MTLEEQIIYLQEVCGAGPCNEVIARLQDELRFADRPADPSPGPGHPSSSRARRGAAA